MSSYMYVYRPGFIMDKYGNHRCLILYGGKLWLIHYINTFGKKLANLWNSLSEKNILEIYSIKHSECWRRGLQCHKSWGQQKMYVMFSLNPMVWRYHEHKSLWTNMFDGEELIYKQEICISCDPQAVAMKKEIHHMLQIVSHVPRWILSIYSIFIGWGGIIKCTVTGCRSYSYSYYALVVHLVSQEHTCQNRHWHIPILAQSKLLSREIF